MTVVFMLMLMMLSFGGGFQLEEDIDPYLARAGRSYLNLLARKDFRRIAAGGGHPGVGLDGGCHARITLLTLCCAQP